MIDEVLLEARLERFKKDEYVKDEAYINGLPGYRVVMHENIKMAESEMVRAHACDHGTEQQLEFINFPPGSVVVFRSVLQGFLEA